MNCKLLLTPSTIYKQVEGGGPSRLTPTLVLANFFEVKKTKSRNFSLGVVPKALYESRVLSRSIGHHSRI